MTKPTPAKPYANFPAELIADAGPPLAHRPPVKGIVQDFTNICGYANGSWLRSSRKVFSYGSPADTREKSWSFGVADSHHLSQSILSARAVQAAWSAAPVNFRRRHLERAADILERDADALRELVSFEVGKCREEAAAEVAGAIEDLRYFAAWAMWGQHGTVRRNGNGGATQITEKYARGIAAIITPWNYPASNVCQKVGPALITGNTVIWRPSPLAPGVAMAITAAFAEAGLPPGVFSTLIEDGAELSQALVQADEIAAVSFTGSTRIGLMIAGVVAGRGGAVQCEMGGKNAVVVLGDADLDVAAARIVQGAFSFSGQKCTAVSRVFVEQRAAAEFEQKLVAAASGLRVGLPHQAGLALGPVISSDQLGKLEVAVAAARGRGARVAIGGERIGGNLANGHFFAPTVLTGVALDDPLMREELFGPVLVVAVVDNLDDAIEEVNRSEYGLASAIFSTALASTRRFVDRVSTGIVKINDVPPGLSAYSPACGWGKSSVGLGERGEEGIDFFTRKKTSYHMV